MAIFNSFLYVYQAGSILPRDLFMVSLHKPSHMLHVWNIYQHLPQKNDPVM